MKDRSVARWALVVIILAILLSPLLYWWTGIGQSASRLPAEISYQPDGTPLSSPKAMALHRLTLPMRIERLLLYPLLLGAFQLSGGALALRRWLESRELGGTRGDLESGGALALRRWLERRLGRRAPSPDTGHAQGIGHPPQPAGRGRGGQGVPLRLVRRVVGSELWVVLLFVIVFDLALSLLYLPFNFYSGFILAHQFGLSRQTAPGWGSDWLKNLLIALVIDGFAWTAFYALLRLMPRRWPIPAGALAMVMSAVFILLAPVLITPLFYTVRPLDDTALRGRIVQLAERAGMEVEGVYVIDASAKTTTANAYFTGFGGGQRIVFYDTMLTGYTPEQVEVVLAHEMGHWYYDHVLLGWLGMGAAGWLGMFALRWWLGRTWRGLGLRGPADVAGLPHILAVMAVVWLLAMPFQNGLSRFGESQADAFSLAISQRPDAFIQVFEKLAVQNLSVVDAPEWEKFVFYTHPPIAERIRAAEDFREKQSAAAAEPVKVSERPGSPKK